MNINICNLEPKKSKYIKNKVEKYIKLLNLKNINIKIKFIKKIPGCGKDTYGLYDLKYVTRPHKIFTDEHVIYINSNILSNRYLLLTALMHELVHVKQYVTGKMAWVKYRLGSTNTYIFWKKKKIGEFCDLDYYSSPWEVEARKIASKMWKEKKL